MCYHCDTMARNVTTGYKINKTFNQIMSLGSDKGLAYGSRHLPPLWPLAGGVACFGDKRN